MAEVEGSPSKWDTSPQTKIQRKIEKIVVISFIVAVAIAFALFLIVLGAAGLLW